VHSLLVYTADTSRGLTHFIAYLTRRLSRTFLHLLYTLLRTFCTHDTPSAALSCFAPHRTAGVTRQRPFVRLFPYCHSYTPFSRVYHPGATYGSYPPHDYHVTAFVPLAVRTSTGRCVERAVARDAHCVCGLSGRFGRFTQHIGGWYAAGVLVGVIPYCIAFISRFARARYRTAPVMRILPPVCTYRRCTRVTVPAVGISCYAARRCYHYAGTTIRSTAYGFMTTVHTDYRYLPYRS